MVLGGTKSPLGRLHALHSLEGLGGLDETTLLVALRDADPNVREHAIKLAERSLSRPGKPVGELGAKLVALRGRP